MTSKKWKLKICTVSKNTGFCFFYRIQWPLQELIKQELVEVVGINSQNDLFLKNPSKYILEAIEWADVIVFQYGNPTSILTKFNDLAIQENLPKLFVSEYDDDICNVHPSNPYYRYSGVEEHKLSDGTFLWKDKDLCDHRNEMENLSSLEKEVNTFDITRNKIRMLKMLRSQIYSDVITTTTEELASKFYGFNQNVAILPNYINPEVMPDGKKAKRDYVLVGWQGGDSHHHDLRMIMPALKRIKNKYGNKVHFRFMGAPHISMYKEIGGEFLPWVDAEKFYKKFSEDLFDIGMVPLLDPNKNTFNLSKSNIKWLEYSYYGIPSVVSGYRPYVQHIEHGKTGILAYNEDDWVNGLSQLIDDSLFRVKMGSEAKKVVEEKFTIQRHARKWYDLYMDALEAKVKFLAEKESVKIG